jgi:hypothetical protein
MFNLFKKVQWKTIPASRVRFGDVVSDVFEGEVLYSYTRTFEDNTLETFVINMPNKLFGTRIAEITVPSDKQIKVAQK